MGFVKWLYGQYKNYKLHKSLPSKDDSVFINNYKRCLDVGFSQEQLLALMNLFSDVKGSD